MAATGGKMASEMSEKIMLPAPEWGEFPLKNFEPFDTRVHDIEMLKPKRLHISNIPFRYRDVDLNKLFTVCVITVFDVVMFTF